MFRINMDMPEIYKVSLEVYIEDRVVQRQIMQAPKDMLMLSFAQTARQISNDSKPMKIKMLVPVVIWDEFENVEKTLNNEAEFKNNAMIAWEEGREKEGE